MKTLILKEALFRLPATCGNFGILSIATVKLAQQMVRDKGCRKCL